MKRHGNDERHIVERRTALCGAQELRQSRADVSFTLQRQDRRAQSAFIYADGARRRVRRLIATPTTHTLAPLRRHLAERQRAALPTARLCAREDVRRLPTRRTRGRIRAPLNVSVVTRRARLWIEQRERRVVQRVELMR